MNPAILEASDDLTNLSHLNEPAGNSMVESNVWELGSRRCSSSGYPTTILAERNLHVQWYCPNRYESFRKGRLPLRSWHGTSLRRQAKIFSSTASVRYS